MCFSGTTGTTSQGLPGAGGQAGSGFPLPRAGFLTSVHLWDGSTYRFDANEIAFAAGDRLSVFCQAGASDYTVKVRLNGNSTGLQMTGVPFSSTLYITVECLVLRA